MSPEWLVKIADLGVSKRAREGETQLRTNIGTRNYMAPEVLGFDPLRAYSVAVDIWAIGIIALELLLKCHPFFDGPIDYLRYIQGSAGSDLGRFLADKGLAPSCRHFLQELLSPEAENRPTAAVARSDLWLNEDEVISVMDTDDE
jgi:serine/threonine protein kinase